MSEPLHPDQYKKQFLLSTQTLPLPKSWLTRRVGRYRLAYCPTLPVHDLTVGTENVGASVRRGVLIGWTPETLAAQDAGPVPLHVETMSALGDMGGRWLYVGEGEDGEDEVRLDPAGSFPFVFDQEARLGAPSSVVMPRDTLREDRSLIATVDFSINDKWWYPFGLTPYQNVRRLLPNHALRLDSFEVYRVPRSTSAVQGLNDEEIYDLIALALRGHMRTLAEAAPLYVALTAGNDSRMLLAALRGHLDRAHFFTIRPASLDIFTARDLARRFGLEHEVIPRVHDAEEEARWLARTGYCIAGAPARNGPLRRAFPRERIFLKGMGLERGMYYRSGDRPDLELSAEDLTARLWIPPHETIHAAARGWLAHAEATDTFDLLDSLYVENRLAAWAAPIGLGDVYPPVCIWPLNLATIIEGSRALSVEAKLRGDASVRVVERLWPELLDVPINAPYGRFKREQTWREVRRKGRRVLEKLGLAS